MLLDNISFYKWPHIETIIQPSGHTAIPQHMTSVTWNMTFVKLAFTILVKWTKIVNPS